MRCVPYFFSIRHDSVIVRHGLPKRHFTGTGTAGNGRTEVRRNRRKEAARGAKTLPECRIVVICRKDKGVVDHHWHIIVAISRISVPLRDFCALQALECGVVDTLSFPLAIYLLS